MINILLNYCQLIGPEIDVCTFTTHPFCACLELVCSMLIVIQEIFLRRFVKHVTLLLIRMLFMETVVLCSPVAFVLVSLSPDQSFHYIAAPDWPVLVQCQDATVYEV
jgi:hypothetical protein